MTIRSKLAFLLVIFSFLISVLFVKIILNISSINSEITKIDTAIKHVNIASQINNSIFEQFESASNYLLWGNEKDRIKALKSRQFINELFYQWSVEEILGEHIVQTDKPLKMKREYNHIMEALADSFKLRSEGKIDKAVNRYTRSVKDNFEELIFYALADVSMEEQDNINRGYDKLLYTLGVIPWLDKKIIAPIHTAQSITKRFILVNSLTSNLNKLYKDGFDYILNGSKETYEDFRVNSRMLSGSLGNLKRLIEIQKIYGMEINGALAETTSMQEASHSLYDLFNKAFTLKKKGKEKEAFDFLKTEIKPFMHSRMLPPLKVLIKGSYKKIGDAHHQLAKTISSAIRFISAAALLFFIFILYFFIKFTRETVSALTDLKAGADEIGKGNLDHKIKVEGKNELAELAHTMNSMCEQLRSTTVSRDLLLSEVEERKKTEIKLLAAKEELEAANEELAVVNEEMEATNEELLNEINERQKLEADLIKSREQAEAASQAKSQFLANMSHDLRTPLNAIIGFSEVLALEAVGNLNDRQKDCLHDIMESGQHLLALINQTLDLSRIEAGKLELNYSEVRINDLIETTLIFVKEKAAHKGINITTEFSHKNMTIETDRLRVKQVLINLIGNAVKFTPSRGKITICLKKTDNGKNMQVSIEDTGTGIREEDMSKVFNVFEQADTSYTKEYEGSGMGLALSRRIVELLGGKIWMESVFGKGSTFFFKIPCKRPEAAGDRIRLEKQLRSVLK